MLGDDAVQVRTSEPVPYKIDNSLDNKTSKLLMELVMSKLASLCPVISTHVQVLIISIMINEHTDQDER